MKKALIIIFAVVIFVFAAIAGIHHFSPTQSDEPYSGTQTSAVPETTEAVLDFEDFEPVNNDNLLNILLVGQDRREGEDRQRSDAMILCSFNPATNELSMISFLRDLYVRIPGYEDNRLNAAYAYGGFELLKETLELNFGITVDGCLESDFEGFEKIIDTVGGVEIELTAEEAEIVGATQGVCNLNGKQALTYARIRKIDSDFQRTGRQRNILNAVFEKVKSYQLMELADLFSKILPMMSTDMTDDEIMTFALTLASSLSEIKTQSYSIPAEGTYKNTTVRGMAVLVPDLEKIRELIFEEYLPM